ncbi:MAG: aldehyde ferredoxin oxidoreductase family protein [Deltaproteobacteria bacterium]|nr:aldehyde ferredoxin oxidoreductase family protein [Deltaproteobacteria bacterium]
MNGYMGAVLTADLTTGTFDTIELDENSRRDYIGGSGLAAKFFLDRIHPGIKALSPENPMIIMTGPLTGVRLPAVPRFTVSSLSPLTGIWGESNVGGLFGPELKFAGYDGIIITGAAPEPVVLSIHEGRPEIRPAETLWGKDIYQTTDILAQQGKKDWGHLPQTLAIGPAGENLVLFASILTNKAHAAGRTGMGAVMGFKKLKAIVVAGKKKIPLADPDGIKALKDRLKEKYDQSIIVETLRSFGTNSHMDLGLMSGDVPIKNWQLGEWSGSESLNGPAYNEKLLVGRKSCFGCPVACKRVVEVTEGPFQVAKGAGPEYETVAGFGTMCLNDDLTVVAKANAICNTMGLDTITCGSTVAFAMECYEKGLLTRDDLDGLDLSWGNGPAMIALVEKIARRDGVGDLFAQGTRLAAERIGPGAAAALTTVKGLESPMHDPRGSHGLGIAYATSIRGACHMSSLTYPVEGGMIFIEEVEELAEAIEAGESQGKAQLNVICQNLGMFFHHGAIFCNLGGSVLNMTDALEAFNLVTGLNLDLNEVMLSGERIWYLKRGISNLFGTTAKDDVLPPRLATPLEAGPTAGLVPDMDLMLRETYEIRQLDPQTGRPKKAKLESLGLTRLVELLYG